MQSVVDWLNDQKANELYITTITIGEIAYGLKIMPEDKRRSGLSDRFERFMALAFTQRILSYDEASAHNYGQIMASRKESGRPLSVSDGQIAAIARSNHMSVATRNIVDFEYCGLELQNPFNRDGR